MSVPISLGDIATILSTLKSICMAFNDARGSASDYRKTVSEVDRFRADLDSIQRVVLPLAQALDATVALSVSEKLEAFSQATGRFLKRVERYKAALGGLPTRGCVFARIYRKMDCHTSMTMTLHLLTLLLLAAVLRPTGVSLPLLGNKETRGRNSYLPKRKCGYNSGGGDDLEKFAYIPYAPNLRSPTLETLTSTYTDTVDLESDCNGSVSPSTSETLSIETW
ncbi:uncharacterized protein B0H18DRAFT_1019194 [Fomitopsis serialis]|uniref:uncharacterized protein n=1 Tax=Fomitopsis serialis TaxID=139415 RepID=UPI002007CE9F|nr:uncharacterized protein B0H18DRAFT_1019194 [Neoantrodia serialis]KAH9922117.1 hypothetical protein B0H18DRAFT_1019194 [Neoantrodia serialis]